MPPAIQVDRLSKHYRLGVSPRTDLNLQESLAHGVRSIWRRLTGRGEPRRDFWALKDVSFEVNPGEVLGIIGRNGAGKSTLLKLLSRVTDPTSGSARVRGRLGSLLEVGTGFHPELTGRENIYLNGSLLGMSRAEIRKKFDAIVAFAEIETFIDTPVKRYSSGMYVRLAFAIAGHLEPEVLLVDEVLAVGDASFQRRCIDRMTQLAAGGRTILFVSHSMDLIPRLCQRAIVLDGGKVRSEGPARETIDAYMRWQIADSSSGDLIDKPRAGDGRARFLRIRHVNEANQSLGSHGCGNDLIFQIEIESSSEIKDVALAVVIHTLTGTRILTTWTREAGFPVNLQPGKQSFRCCFRGVWLRPGHRFSVQLWMADRVVIDSVEHAHVLEVTAAADQLQLSTDSLQGAYVCPCDWAESS